MNSLKKLGVLALSQLEALTFKLDTVKTKASATGNVGYRAILADGRAITFWDTTMDGTIEAIDDETFKVKHGLQLAYDKRDDAFGLIDPTKQF